MERDEWLAALSSRIGTEDIELDSESLHIVLDLARDAAHEVERPAAPLTTFLIGVAVGRGATLGAAAAQATELILSLPNDDPAGNAPATEEGASGD